MSEPAVRKRCNESSVFKKASLIGFIASSVALGSVITLLTNASNLRAMPSLNKRRERATATPFRINEIPSTRPASKRCKSLARLKYFCADAASTIPSGKCESLVVNALIASGLFQPGKFLAMLSKAAAFSESFSAVDTFLSAGPS